MSPSPFALVVRMLTVESLYALLQALCPGGRTDIEIRAFPHYLLVPVEVFTPLESCRISVMVASNDHGHRRGGTQNATCSTSPDRKS